MDIDSLYAAAIGGDTGAILKLEIEADKPSSYNRTILHNESRFGNTERVRFIVTELANKNLLIKLESRGSNTALHLAAEHGHTKVVEVLIDAARRLPSSSAENDSRDPVTSFQAFLRQPNYSKSTALHIAVRRGNTAIARLLVEADPSNRHIQNSEGETPIYVAANLGHYDIVKMMCTACTAPSLDGPDGTTALHAAIEQLHKATRADRDVIKVYINAAKRFTAYESLFLPNRKGETALELAVRGNHLDVVELILAEDPAYKRENVNKNDELLNLIYIAAEQRYKDMVKLLCETYESRNSLAHRGHIAFLAAIKGRDKESALHLLGEDRRLVTYADNKGWTPLHYAADCEFDSVLNAIVSAQVHTGYQSVCGDRVPTPLTLAASKGYTSTVIQLLKLLPASSCVDVNNEGRNILHLAAVQSNIQMVQCIVQYCPEEYKDTILNNKDVNGDTPLHLLIREGCFVPELIKHKGVDTTAENNKNWTPLDMLYFSDEIIADQVQIRKAIDTRNNQHWGFWCRSVKGKSNTRESLVPPSKRSKKDAAFEKAKNLLRNEKRKSMKEELERYKKRTNTQIIVTALITTVTFTVGFTMPGGYHQSGESDQGLALLSQKTPFKTFMVADALALLLSTSSLFLYFIESMYEDPQKVANINAASTGLSIVSVIAMMLTFITGIYVVLSHSPVLAITVCVIGSLFFVFVIILLIKLIYDYKLERHEV